jgi:hypothetical protein
MPEERKREQQLRYCLARNKANKACCWQALLVRTDENVEYLQILVGDIVVDDGRSST